MVEAYSTFYNMQEKKYLEYRKDHWIPENLVLSITMNTGYMTWNYVYE